jgi:prepilin peptidase CpaA
MLYFLLIATVVTGVAAWTDFRTGHIPNWLTVPALVVGIVGHGVLGWYVAGPREGLIEAATSVAGVVLCSVAPGIMFWKGGMGGGDLKLFAALGALLHPMIGIEAEMYAFVVAALVAPARLAYEGRLFRVLKNSLALLLNPLRSKNSKQEIPPEVMTWFRLGPAIFVGTLAALIAHAYAL